MRYLRLILPAAALIAPMPAMAACQVAKMLDIPVTMNGRQPMVSGRFGDKEARFILDSGAFYSTLSRASAAEFGQRVETAPAWFRLQGIGGDTSAGYIVSNNFSLGSVTIPKANFVVGGSDTGTAGLLGQNILGLADVEYDLPHGSVRLMKTTGCAKMALAYWAGDKPVTLVPLIVPPAGLWKPHTIGTILLNGVKIRAMFDSGAYSSVVSLGAAKRAGITPDSAGVVRTGFSRGLGTRQVPSWLAPFDSIDIGGEAIRRPRIAISEIGLEGVDMLVGADFFLTHRMFVSNANRAIYITYEGGPVFNLSPKGAMSSDGTKLDLTSKAAEPTGAEEYSRRGAIALSNHKITDALLDFDKACTLAPTEGRYFYQRAQARLLNRQRDAALGDLDRSIQLAPNDPDAHIERAGLTIHEKTQASALDDVTAADHALAPSSDKRLMVASLYTELDRYEAAITNYEQWLASHAEDSSRPRALNGRCWARGLLGRDIDKALADCNAAVRAQPGNASFLDSRGLIRLRRGETDKALADYSAALKLDPRNGWSLYMRSVVETKTGATAQAESDRALALSINPKVAERAHKIGF
ncbi:aspartyl protease family protein [Sphingomonas sp. RB3P16]|uniref:aspartyl protease family protein n=1 Tax=Parasphingomonas frigoris TaxID=3096163 RepID=UPI002FC6CBCA